MYYDFVVQCPKRKTSSFSLQTTKRNFRFEDNGLCTFVLRYFTRDVTSCFAVLFVLFFKQVRIANGSEHTTKQTTHFKSLLGSNSFFSPRESSSWGGSGGFPFFEPEILVPFSKKCAGECPLSRRTLLTEFRKLLKRNGEKKSRDLDVSKKQPLKDPTDVFPVFAQRKRKGAFRPIHPKSAFLVNLVFG